MSLENQSLKVDTSIMGIILLTLPISMAKLIPELNYLFNAIFLGQLGSVELAMAGITGVYYLVFAAIGYGLNNALLAIMSRMAGEDNRDEIFSILWHGLLVATIMAVVFIGFTWGNVEPILIMTGMDPVNAKMASSFLDIRIVGLVFLYCLQMQNAYLITLQQTKYLIIIAIIESSLNLVLDYGLIFGHFGMPKMGFNGAAYASVISEFVGMITVAIIIRWKQLSRRFNIKPIFYVSVQKLKLVFVQGLPLMSQLAISTLAWWMFFILVNRNYSYEDQAASQAMRNLFGLSGVFTWAFGSSANTIISNLIGQGRQEEIFIIIRKMCIISFTGILVLSIGLNLFPSVFLGLFGQDGTFIETGIGLIRVVSIAMLIVTLGVIWLNSVVATGKTTVVFWIEFAAILGYTVFTWLAVEVYHVSIIVAWMNEWIYWSVMLILSTIYLKFGKWREGLSYY